MNLAELRAIAVDVDNYRALQTHVKHLTAFAGYRSVDVTLQATVGVNGPAGVAAAKAALEVLSKELEVLKAKLMLLGVDDFK